MWDPFGSSRRLEPWLINWNFLHHSPPGLTYEEHSIAILDRDERKVKRNMVKFVKVQWINHTEDEATWEREDQLRQEYPDFFSDE